MIFSDVLDKNTPLQALKILFLQSRYVLFWSKTWKIPPSSFIFVKIAPEMMLADILEIEQAFSGFKCIGFIKSPKWILEKVQKSVEKIFG